MSEVCTLADCLRGADMDPDLRTRWEAAEEAGRVRLRVCEDDSGHSIDDLAGDWDPSLSPEELEEQRAEFARTVERDGVWGLCGEFYDGERWRFGDSVWALIGAEDVAAVAPDVCAETLADLDSLTHCPTCGRPGVGSGGRVVHRAEVPDA